MKTEDIRKRLEEELENDFQSGTSDVLVRTVDDTLYLGHLVKIRKNELDLENAWEIMPENKEKILGKYVRLSEHYPPGQVLSRYSYPKSMIESISVETKRGGYYSIQTTEHLEIMINNLLREIS